MTTPGDYWMTADSLGGFCAALWVYAAGLPAVSGTDQGQSRKRREICEAQCPRGPPVCVVGRLERLAAGVDGDGRGSARPWDDS